MVDACWGYFASQLVPVQSKGTAVKETSLSLLNLWDTIQLYVFQTGPVTNQNKTLQCNPDSNNFDISFWVNHGHAYLLKYLYLSPKYKIASDDHGVVLIANVYPNTCDCTDIKCTDCAE